MLYPVRDDRRRSCNASTAVRRLVRVARLVAASASAGDDRGGAGGVARPAGRADRGGKTLAGFLPSLVELAERGPRPASGPGSGVHTLYLSPLKALTTDVERNLMTPIREIGLNIHVESRTGDTKQSKRQRQRDFPPDILLTTPEQLALFCAWDGARDYFADLKCVVLDEVHAIWSGKRGDLLSLGLGRLQQFAPGMRRVAPAATACSAFSRASAAAFSSPYISLGLCVAAVTFFSPAMVLPRRLSSKL